MVFCFSRHHLCVHLQGDGEGKDGGGGGWGGLVKREEMACFFAFLTLLDISMQQAHAFYWCACSVWESVCCCCHTRIVWERCGIAEIFIHGQDKCLIKQGDNWMACLFIQPTSKFNLRTPLNVRPYLILAFFFFLHSLANINKHCTWLDTMQYAKGHVFLIWYAICESI